MGEIVVKMEILFAPVFKSSFVGLESNSSPDVPLLWFCSQAWARISAGLHFRTYRVQLLRI